MKRLGAGIVLLMFTGCASTSDRASRFHSADRKARCTRFDAAMKVFDDGFNPIKMQKKAIEDCRRGDPAACVALPLAVPYMTFLAIGSAPFLVPLFMASDNVYRRACPEQTPPTPRESPEEPTPSEEPPPSDRAP